jgi:hypothetical protein
MLRAKSDIKTIDYKKLEMEVVERALVFKVLFKSPLLAQGEKEKKADEAKKKALEAQKKNVNSFLSTSM